MQGTIVTPTDAESAMILSRKCSAITPQTQIMSMSVVTHPVGPGLRDPSTKMCDVLPPSAVTILTTMLLTLAHPVLDGQDIMRTNVCDIP
jgi:hypothetical protein